MRGNETRSKQRKFTGIAALAALLAITNVAGVNSVWAITTIVQEDDDAIVGNVGSGWLAFDVEDFHQMIDVDNDGKVWEVVDDVNADPKFGAFGGKVLEAPQGVNFTPDEAEAVFNVMFTIPDQYRVYARYKNLGEQGDNDSFYTSGDPNSFPISPLSTWFGNGTAEIGRTIGSDPNQLDDPGDPDGDPPTPPTPQYFYASVGLANIGIVNSIAEINEVHEFRIGIREQGSILDRIVFVDDTAGNDLSGMTGGGRYAPLFQLDALPNSPVETDSVLGDYNGNGVVDAGDYTAWLDNLGAADESSINDNGDGLNGVDAADYGFWKSRFGNTAGAGVGTGGSTIPEPATWLLLLVGTLAFARKRRA